MKQIENSDQTPGLPRLAYSMRETAEILGVSYITVHRWIKGGLLKCSWASRHKLIPLSEIQRFLNETLE
jgi:predicted site-specific integrase-resolvase